MTFALVGSGAAAIATAFVGAAGKAGGALAAAFDAAVATGEEDDPCSGSSAVALATAAELKVKDVAKQASKKGERD
jgi:hypothetical protein